MSGSTLYEWECLQKEATASEDSACITLPGPREHHWHKEVWLSSFFIMVECNTSTPFEVYVYHLGLLILLFVESPAADSGDAAAANPKSEPWAALPIASPQPITRYCPKCPRISKLLKQCGWHFCCHCHPHKTFLN